jgi:hypothetical protein
LQNASVFPPGTDLERNFSGENPVADEWLVNRMLRICQDKRHFLPGQEALKNICCDLVLETECVRLDVELGSTERDLKLTLSAILDLYPV